MHVCNMPVTAQTKLVGMAMLGGKKAVGCACQWCVSAQMALVLVAYFMLPLILWDAISKSCPVIWIPVGMCSASGVGKLEMRKKGTHRGARTHDHKVKGLALCRLS